MSEFSDSIEEGLKLEQIHSGSFDRESKSKCSRCIVVLSIIFFEIIINYNKLHLLSMLI